MHLAFLSGLIIFPACFAFGISPDQGPGLVFITLPNVFNQMPAGRIWGTLFFAFLSLAAIATVIAVFQNIIAFAEDLWGWNNFIKEANTGKGLKFPTQNWVRVYVTYILPVIVLGIFIQGYWSKFVK